MQGRTLPNVHFAQLNGMGDPLSIALATNGVSCLKLVPCGSVNDVLPWLARRMQENSDAFKRTEFEREMISKEIWSRLKNYYSFKEQ